MAFGPRIGKYQRGIPTPTDEEIMRATQVPVVKAAGAGQAGQAKTGPLFSALGLVMIVNCIDRLVKIVT